MPVLPSSSQVPFKSRKQKPENRNQVDLAPDLHSPVEEVPVEQTRVYQNQPDGQSPVDPNPPVQPEARSTPESPPPIKPGGRKETSQSGPAPDTMGQNSIEEDPATRGGLTNGGLDGNAATWVSEMTEQPGFLFPVAPPTTSLPSRRQITEEASLAVTPNQVVGAVHRPSPAFYIFTQLPISPRSAGERLRSTRTRPRPLFSPA